MKRIKSFAALTALIMVFSTCDELVPEIDDLIEEVPEPTMVGVPNGIPVSKTIGSAGGSVSIDGAVEIEIPAGALSADTEITIQPLTNNSPNGNGNAYRLGPDGTNFSKPVKVTFPYTPIVDGPAITGIAFQDDDGIWYSGGKLSWDNVKNTVTTETTHFSDWATFDALQVICEVCNVGPSGDYKLKESESADFKLYAVNPNALEEELVALTKKRDDHAYDKIIKEWFANGAKAETMGTYGKIAPTPMGCTYTAPSKAPGKSGNPVSLSVTLKDLAYKDPATGAVFRNLQVATNVEILGERKFDLSIRFFDPDIPAGLVDKTFTLKDSASFKVVLKGDVVTFSDFNNSPGVIIPTSITDNLGNKSTCTSTSFLGPFNFTECTGFISDITPGNRDLWLTIKGTNEMPTFKWVAATGGEATLGGDNTNFVLNIVLDLKQETPTWESPGVAIIKAKLIEVE